MVQLARPFAVEPVQPVDPAMLDARAAELVASAERIATRPMTAEQAEIATAAMLAALPGDVSPWAPWSGSPAGGVPGAAERALAEAAGLAATAAQLALHGGPDAPQRLALAELHLARAVKLQRTAGGAARGAGQTAEAAAWWAPWIERHRQLVVAGLSPRHARSAVCKAMVAQGVPLPEERSIRAWLR